MKKQEQVKFIANELGVTKKEAEQILKVCFVDLIEEIAQNHEKAKIEKYISISQKTVAARPEREGRNPSTGETMVIPAKPAHRDVAVKRTKALKDLVNE